EAHVDDKYPKRQPSRQAVLATHRDYKPAIALGDWVWQHNQTAVGLTCKLFDALLDLGGVARIGRHQLYLERRRSRIDGTPHPLLRLLVGIANDGHVGNLRCNLLEQLQRLPVLLKLARGEAGDVAFPNPQAGDQTAAD